MLRIPTANEFEEYSERAYVLALDPSRSSFPSYADGIKTKEDFLQSQNEDLRAKTKRYTFLSTAARCAVGYIFM